MDTIMHPDPRIVWAIEEPMFFFAAEDEKSLTVCASPLVPADDSLWVSVHGRLNGRDYVELPTETEQDPTMMFGCGVWHMYLFMD